MLGWQRFRSSTKVGSEGDHCRDTLSFIFTAVAACHEKSEVATNELLEEPQEVVVPDALDIFLLLGGHGFRDSAVYCIRDALSTPFVLAWSELATMHGTG